MDKYSRKKKLLLNSITSLLLQLVSIICAFILPRLILQVFGSSVNGLVSSISQFLGVIALMDLGVGSVVRSALYKPLADKNTMLVSKIYVSSNKFFRNIGFIFLGYTFFLIVFYPFIVDSRFDYLYIATLIGVMCVSSFFQYYYGITNSLLLQAHQKLYIHNSVQAISVILNTVICTAIILAGGSIHIVELASSLIFIVRPLYLNYYVSNNYSVDKNIKYNEEPIKQKWNGISQHFAAFVLEGTDSIVLTIMTSLELVSIYYIYNMVLLGAKGLVSSLTNGFSPLVGEMLAKGEMDNLKSLFSFIEWSIHTIVIIAFGCAGILIVPFVSVYTRGVYDVNYIQPVFAALITLAHASHILRIPYNIIILAAGHYKQTQCCYIIAMILNIVISILTVKIWGLIGVAVGSFVALAYQTVWMALYNSKNIIFWPMNNFLKQILIDAMTLLLLVMLSYNFSLSSIDYISWIIMAVKVLFVSLCAVFIVNTIFYRNNIKYVMNSVCGRIIDKN